MSLFPGITALVALTGLALDPNILIENSKTLASLLPERAADIVLGQLREVLGADSRSLGFAATFSLGVACYSASRAIENFVTGLNIIYEEKEGRGFITRTLLKMALTFGLILGTVLTIVIVAAVPSVASWFGNTVLASVVMFARWPILLLIGAVGIALLFRFGPDRRAAKWRWLTPGAAVACLLWLASSVGFSFYVQSFGTYNETFGALGGVIVLLTWLWISAFVILFGALVDAELEAQTVQDSTVGEDRPMGKRGAFKADTLGKSYASQTPLRNDLS